MDGNKIESVRATFNGFSVDIGMNPHSSRDIGMHINFPITKDKQEEALALMEKIAREVREFEKRINQ
jgi:hypothetical protein